MLESVTEEILIITGLHKRPTEGQFESNVELEEKLATQENSELLELVNSTINAELFFVRQAYPKSFKDTNYQSKSFKGDKPFVIMLGNNIMESVVDQEVANDVFSVLKFVKKSHSDEVPSHLAITGR